MFQQTFPTPSPHHGSSGKESTYSAGDTGDVGSIPGSERSPGEGNGSPLQYSCLGKRHKQRSLAGYSPWGHKQLEVTEHTHAHQPKPPPPCPPCQLPNINLRLNTSGEVEMLGQQENESQFSFSTVNAPPQKHVFKIKEVLPSPTVPPHPFSHLETPASAHPVHLCIFFFGRGGGGEGRGMERVGSYFPDQESNPPPSLEAWDLNWKHGTAREAPHPMHF